ncbi:MAG: pyridoxamine 5'-phosphate oxidase family protein [Actinobacteria bacterium]|nr:pyridoxamine 5'-phosphate oxidase family protein [Actinomycetota bacterium]
MHTLTSQRLPYKMREERELLDELLDASVLAHIGLVVDGRAVVFPTGFAAVDGEIVVHGSTGSRWMRALSGSEATVEVTKLDAVVVARSTFESSMQYRSAMIFGRFEPVSEERKAALLDAYSDRVIPGRSAELRPPHKKEIAATMALAMPIEQWSLRVSEDWPDDDEADIAGDAWAGIVSFGPPPARIEPAPDLRAGIPVPPSVLELAAHPERVV